MMSAEIIATIIASAFTVITLAVTIYLTNKSTQKILKGHDKILERIAYAIHDIAHLTEKVASHSAVDLGLQGIEIAEDVASREEAEKLGEVIKYNPKLKVCYYKPKKSTAN